MNQFSLIITFIVFNLFTMSNSFAQEDDCTKCHKIQFSKDIHYENIECVDCHEDATAEKHTKKLKPVDCSQCHESNADLSKFSIHSRLTDRIDDPPTCSSCHKPHKIKAISKIKNLQEHFCSDCHENIILANKYHSKVEENETCIECHDSEDINLELQKSVHNQLKCADCHNQISNDLEKHSDNLAVSQRADCYLCHNDVAVVHRESIHGVSIEAGVDEAAFCWDCHGAHNVVNISDSLSPVNSKILPATCGQCHDNSAYFKKFDWSIKSPSKMYYESVHSTVIAEGKEGPNCSNCHGIHDIKNRVQDGSKIATTKIPETCGECHKKIVEEYTNSIHWIKALKGIRSAPVCNDCHSEHSISLINSTNKRSEIKRIQDETCFTCHQSKMLAQRYGLDSDQSGSYRDSYHGMAVMSGDEDAALCVDCHGVHQILPRDHELSTINDDNLVGTCAKCHEDANLTFAKSYTHTTVNEESAFIEGLVEYVYVWIIILTIGGMFLHNLLIFISEIRERRRLQNKEFKVSRFNKNEIIQHFLLLISFLLLVITGFALKYPESVWLSWLKSLGMTETVRQNVHRISAVVLIAVSIYHFVYLIINKNGRKLLKDMVPKIADINLFVKNVMYYLKLTKEKPKFDKFSYIEKAEYWALIWGTVVMTVTGFILWFPTIIGEGAPLWLLKVSEMIHFYEAILASLAILVWHWFFVIFRIDQYPVSFTFIDGQITFSELRHHHKKLYINIYNDISKFSEGKIEETQLCEVSKEILDEIREKGMSLQEFLDQENPEKEE